MRLEKTIEKLSRRIILRDFLNEGHQIGLRAQEVGRLQWGYRQPSPKSFYETLQDTLYNNLKKIIPESYITQAWENYNKEPDTIVDFSKLLPQN
jgi:hypothetical protein